MPAWLQPIVKYIVSRLLAFGGQALLEWFDSLKRSKEREEQEKANEATREKLHNDIQEGKSDEEIAKSLENALNRTKP